MKQYLSSAYHHVLRCGIAFEQPCRVVMAHVRKRMREREREIEREVASSSHWNLAATIVALSQKLQQMS
jgi:hypothetical protein